MPFPEGSLTTKSAVQGPAPAFTTATCALLGAGACGAGEELCAAMEIDTAIRPATQPASHTLCESCIAHPLRAETELEIPARLPYANESITQYPARSDSCSDP